ncbi:adenylyltransferase/cytidyltransferase family protein [Nonomuraea sp. NPDC050663]|uniref:adenylyltransferase/cytidyltransferase family protein n=1 Tax=Nonomuraea sp. NPDC050663 TaxID=3364370 RepID=UPI00181C02F8|nr:adenylyltransferase/cytidyltransferase family protein [Thermoactinospora sp.]
MGNLEAVWVRPVDGPGAALVTGVFDILHVGHVRFLEAVAARGLPLVVGIEDDERVRAWKGPTRPLNSAAERAELMAALRCVSGVFIVTGPPEAHGPEDYIDLFAPMRPGALAHTAGDPHAGGRCAASALLGAECWELEMIPGRSTTRIVNAGLG